MATGTVMDQLASTKADAAFRMDIPALPGSAEKPWTGLDNPSGLPTPRPQLPRLAHTPGLALPTKEMGDSTTLQVPLASAKQ